MVTPRRTQFLKMTIERLFHLHLGYEIAAVHSVYQYKMQLTTLLFRMASGSVKVDFSGKSGIEGSFSEPGI